MSLYIVVAETGDGQDFKYDLRFHFATEAPALALSKRLNQAATSTFSLDQLPEQRQGSNHVALCAAALAVLQSLDPQAPVLVRYKVRQVEPYVGPTEPAPTSNFEALFRAIRDLG